MLKKTQILIYQDQGAEQNCVEETLRSFKNSFFNSYVIKTINAFEIKETAWEKNTAIFVMPGGRSLPFYKALGEKGNAKIIEFVKNGGIFFGICAGAYYGCAVTEFEKGQELEVLCQGPLNFFPGVAAGSAYGINQFHYQNYRGARVAQINWLGKQTYSVYFNGGAAFVNAEQYENIEIIARYEDMENKPAAIIRCQVGNGSAILSSVHPEFSAAGIDLSQPFAVAIKNKLQEIEQQRQYLWNDLMTCLSH